MEQKPLSVTNPELLKEWDYKNNLPLTPESVTRSSGRKVWWTCSKGHQWHAVINLRVRGSGCPFCSGRIAIKGVNDLLTTNPELAKEWNYDKNSSDKPEHYKAGSSKKVWWKCPNGHEWQATIYSRTKGDGCPYCSGHRVLQGFNDLCTLCPEIAKEWDYERNGSLLPEEVSSNSNKKAWWKCKLNHSWLTGVNHRVRGQGCPYCAGRAVAKGFNDLATKHPELAVEWNYDKNGELTASDVTCGSTKKVWWKCEYGHEWEAKVLNRVHGRSCPYCSNNGSSKTEQAIAFYLNQCCEIKQRLKINGMEIDVFLPKYNVGIEYDGRRYHLNTEKDKEKTNRLSEMGIALFHVIESTEDKVIDRNVFFNYDYMGAHFEWALRTLFFLISEYVKNEIFKNIDVNIKRDYIGIREKAKLLILENSLSEKCPDVAKQWNYTKNGILKPEMFFAGSEELVWWVCTNGHEWQAQINSRVNGCGCPYCAGQRPIKGVNDLTTTNPELLKEWDYEKNKMVSPDSFMRASTAKVWWKCELGHEWQAVIASRSRGCKCPYCSNKLVLKGFNDLATRNPVLAKEWNYEKNTSVLPEEVSSNSNKKVWWKCAKGHEWQAVISSRNKGIGCPVCSGRKIVNGINDLATTHPNLLEEWDYEKNGELSPHMLSFGSNIRVNWKCKYGHEWVSSPNSRSKGTCCPQCAKQIRKRKVYCVETGAIYDGMRDAERATGVYYTHISACCRGHRKTAGGYHWQFVNER